MEVIEFEMLHSVDVSIKDLSEKKLQSLTFRQLIEH